MQLIPFVPAQQQQQQQQQRGGGLIGRYRKPNWLVEGVTVRWSWYDENNGIVEWTFKNNTSDVATVALFRNGYYFGGAFWPIYLNYSDFNTQWLGAEPQPLEDKGVENNSPPLALITKNATQYLVAFAFTLGPGEEWSMLEGGFIPGQLVPSGIQLVPLKFVNVQKMCIGYPQQAVQAWDAQTGTNMAGYQPNPRSFDVTLFTVPQDAPFTDPFPPLVGPGACHERCMQVYDQMLAAIERDDLRTALHLLATFLQCLITSMTDDELKEMTKMKDLLKKLLTGELTNAISG